MEIFIQNTRELIYIDGTLRESATDAVEYTTFPIGRAGVVSDHRIIRQPELTLELVVLDNPEQTPPSNVAEGATIVKRVLKANNQSLETTGPSAPLERGKRVYRRLLEAMYAGEPLEIKTTRRFYDVMYLTSVSHDVNTPEFSTYITCNLTQVKFVDSRKGEVVLVNRLKRKSEPDKDAGKELEALGSVLSNVVDSGKAVLKRGTEFFGFRT